MYLAARHVTVPISIVIIVVVLFAVGVALTRPCEEDLKCIDPGPIVIDEVMGMLITLFRIPVGWAGYPARFLLFRALDVVKPFPARQLERLHGGFGVMSDDAMAAIYANLLLRGVYPRTGMAIMNRARRGATASPQQKEASESWRGDCRRQRDVDADARGHEFAFVTERLNEIGIDLSRESGRR